MRVNEGDGHVGIEKRQKQPGEEVGLAGASLAQHVHVGLCLLGRDTDGPPEEVKEAAGTQGDRWCSGKEPHGTR